MITQLDPQLDEHSQIIQISPLEVSLLKITAILAFVLTAATLAYFLFGALPAMLLTAKILFAMLYLYLEQSRLQVQLYFDTPTDPHKPYPKFYAIHDTSCLLEITTHVRQNHPKTFIRKPHATVPPYNLLSHNGLVYRLNSLSCFPLTYSERLQLIEANPFQLRTNGLTDSQVRRSRELLGSNSPIRSATGWLMLRRLQKQWIFVLVIMVTLSASLIAVPLKLLAVQIAAQSTLSLVCLAVISSYSSKTYSQYASKYSNVEYMVIRDGQRSTIRLESIVVGDVVEIEPASTKKNYFTAIVLDGVFAVRANPQSQELSMISPLASVSAIPNNNNILQPETPIVQSQSAKITLLVIQSDSVSSSTLTQASFSISGMKRIATRVIPIC